ncbi:signal transduction histidine kinase [Hoeflea sp. IMCC20628]|uniref:ATP-binding protein n=1 Tax=Hoeflea sp. IMCC20628 TaxID=1620421 RepID=UPI00063BDCED|nr:ATP-binding protein [Hoeflea sp. IMCC20628]AKI02478.1 signal transduction histidine kinase [Hoeflea sp. IMCC20628]
MARNSASRALFTASAAMAAAAISVAFNAPAMLLASVAGIAVFAAVPLLRRSLAKPVSPHPARAMAEKAALAERDIDRNWELGEFSGHLATVFDALGDMVTACNLDGRIVYANQTFRKATGCDNPVGLTLDMAGIKLTATNETGGRELVLGGGDEQTIWTWHETASRDPSSGDLFINCIGRNVTAARRAETELVEARKKAEAANHAKSRFLATVSHEIRTPLNGILGMTHLLEQTETTPEQASYLKTARESGHSLLSLIEDLLDVTSIEAGRLHLRHEEGDLEDLVNGVSELMASRAHEKDIEIAVHIAAEAPVRITSDIGRLRQVLFNLVGNAIKFTETGGVLVEVVREDTHLAFIVSDTGPGLKDADKSRIFSEFERADNGPTRKQGGAGLGLSISARIVEALGGEIGVTSAPGQGSTFKFTVPIRELATPEASKPVCGTLEDRAVLVIAPRGPVSTALLWTIRDLGGIAETADDAETMMTALTRLYRSGATLSDIVVDRRIADRADSLLAAAPVDLPDTIERTLVIAPEDSRDLDSHSGHAADAWLVRPVRRASLINVLTRRDDRDDRDRLSCKMRPVVLERASDNPTLDILLAEDDPVNALVVRSILARQGHRVTVVDNGRKLVDEAMERPGGAAGYDLVITDLSMPELDGRSAILQIRAEEAASQLSRLPIIVLSADGHASTSDDLLAAGADGHAEKPVDPQWLLQLAAVTARKRQTATG